jgi:hypothetical protein
MLRAGFTDATIYKRLISLAQGCGRDIRQDITHSIDTGRMYLGIGKGFGILKFDSHHNEISSLRDLPKLDLEYQQHTLEQHQDIRIGIWPYCGPQREYNTMEILYDLYGKNRICYGYSQRHAAITRLTPVNSFPMFVTRTKLELCQFIVPTPMAGESAMNKTGKQAVRCLANTCERWFLVLESDLVPSQDDQIRLHYHLSQNCDLRMLVFSGHESVHGWYDVYGKPEKESKKLMKEATRLGFDPMTWIRCQYVRFPGGINAKTKKKQTILYYDGK